jgi:hypothetical protein
MSRIAGILLILAGAMTILLGGREIGNYTRLTPYAAWSSIALGGLLLLVGLAHFRAPHKSFLLSIPILITWVLLIYSIGLFYDIGNLMLFVAGHAIAAVVILVLSYLGYRNRQALATV